MCWVVEEVLAEKRDRRWWWWWCAVAESLAVAVAVALPSTVDS
jgi:hypothetical protein